MSSLHGKNDQVLDDRSLDFVPPEHEGVIGATIGLMRLTVELVTTIPERIIKFGSKILHDTSNDL